MYPHRFETLTPEEVVAASVARGPDPDHAPGEHQDYGNIHYTVLAMLVEKVTGDSYAHQAAVRIFRPLGMRHTSFPDGPDPRIHGPHNRGYEWIDGELVDVTDWNMSDRWAAGDMISTTADLERLLTGVFRGRVVPEPQLKEMFAVPAVPGATMGAPFSAVCRAERPDGLGRRPAPAPAINSVLAPPATCPAPWSTASTRPTRRGHGMSPIARALRLPRVHTADGGPGQRRRRLRQRLQPLDPAVRRTAG